MWMNTIHAGGAPHRKMSVYYTGSDTLYEGYALFYDFNAADVNQENESQTSPDVGEEYFNASRRLLVEKCTEKNKLHFAGVVAEESDGVEGPGWVTIHTPGSICNVYANSNVDHERSADGNASGQILNPVVGQYYFKDGGFPGCGAAIVLQDVDRSSTAGLVMAELMIGAPSGGFTIVAVPSASGSLSVELSAIPVYAGVYEFTQQTLASGPILSSAMLAADGKWVGQRVLFKANDTAFASSCVSIQVSTVTKSQFSTYACAIASAEAEISATGDYYLFEYNGVRWQVQSAHESLIT